jgi:glycosyltransferase involved in cell wall biosynthesis
MSDDSAVPLASVARPPELAVVAFQSGRRANGGLESLFEIARRLRRVRPFLVTQRESEYTERWRAAGLEALVWELPNPDRRPSRLLARYARNAWLLGMNRRFATLLRARGVRVVHCNDGSAMAMAGVGARRAGARIALNIRDTALGNLVKWLGYRLLADEIVVLSEEMRQFVELRLELPNWCAARGAPITAIYSIVDTERLSPPSEPARAELRARLGIAPETFAVGVVAAFAPKKQQLELLEALAREAARIRPGISFYFVGDFEPDHDGYAAACRRALEGSSVEHRVRFVGFTPEPECWYRALDLTLLPSRTEGLARSTIESMACGTPVVAFDFCSAREVIERHDAGFVVAQGDFTGLLARVDQFAADAALRERCSANAVRTARTLFDPSQVVTGYERVYERLGSLASPQRGARIHGSGSPP